MKLFTIVLAALLPCLAAGPAVDKGKAFGNPAAPIRIEVYHAFDCSHCKDLDDHVVPLLMKDYVTKGKVYLVNREFPLLQHPYSREAAAYATAGARIGKYQQVSSALFQSQATWASNGKLEEAVAGVLTPAERKRVQELIKDPSVLSEVQQELDAGLGLGINQTPTLIITRGQNVYPQVGEPNYELLAGLLNGLLAK